MSRAYVFSDEAGCFAFARNSRASRYFMVCTITTDSCAIGDNLQSLRRDLVWRGLPVKEELHASEDKQNVRDEVYEFLAKQDFRIDATLLEKSKAQPHTRATDDAFYKYALFYHFKHIGPKILRNRELSG